MSIFIAVVVTLILIAVPFGFTYYILKGDYNNVVKMLGESVLKVKDLEEENEFLVSQRDSLSDNLQDLLDELGVVSSELEEFTNSYESTLELYKELKDKYDVLDGLHSSLMETCDKMEEELENAYPIPRYFNNISEFQSWISTAVNYTGGTSALEMQSNMQQYGFKCGYIVNLYIDLQDKAIGAFTFVDKTLIYFNSLGEFWQ